MFPENKLFEQILKKILKFKQFWLSAHYASHIAVKNVWTFWGVFLGPRMLNICLNSIKVTGKNKRSVLVNIFKH